MSYRIESTIWKQWYHPDYQYGWIGEPEVGTELGRMSVRTEPDQREGHEFIGFHFRGALTFIKEILHRADPLYIVRFSAGERQLTEDEVPEDILAAFVAGDTGEDHRIRI